MHAPFVSAAIAALWLVSVVHAAEGPRLIALDARKAQALGIVVEPLREDASGALTLPGRVVIPPSQIQVVAAPVAGLVESVSVAPQQEVKPGQALVRLVSPMLLEAQRDYVQAESQWRLAEANLRRDEALYREGIIAEGRLAASRAAHAQAAALLRERRETLRLLGLGQRTLAMLGAGGSFASAITLVAPKPGTVLEVAAVPGQRVEAATPLVRLARLAPLWIELQASAEDAAAIAPGLAVSARGARGRVVSVARVLDAASQSLAVRAEMTEGLAGLRPGEYVTAQVALSRARRGQRLPANALFRLEGKPHVFVAREQGFVATPVRVLTEDAGVAVVSGEFPDGARVAVSGVAALKALLTGAGAE